MDLDLNNDSQNNLPTGMDEQVDKLGELISPTYSTVNDIVASLPIDISNKGIPADGRSTLASIRSNLQSIRKNASHLSSDTEKDFLGIGEALFSFKNETNSLNQHFKDFLETIAGEETEKVFDAITYIMDEIDSSLAVVNKNIQRDLKFLLEINEIFERILGFEPGFEKIVKTLEMYSRVTRIESTALRKMGKDFNTLGKNIESLSYQIRDKFTKFFQMLRNVRKTIGKIIGRMQQLKDLQVNQTQANIKATLTRLINFTGRQTSSYRLAEQVAYLSEDIENRFAEVMMSLQHHDIIRQKLEHVVSVFEDVNGKLEDFENCEPASEEAVPKFYLALLTARASFHLEIAQSVDARNDFNKAIHSIFTNLKGIGHDVSQLCDQVETLGGSTKLVQDDFFKEIEHGMVELMDMLQGNTANRDELVDLILSVSRDVQQFSGFIAEIEEIGSNIETTALNARIKAARAGSEGAAMAVVAEHIKEASMHTQSDTERLLHDLKEITVISEELQKSIASKESNKWKFNGHESMDALEKQLTIFQGTHRRLLHLVGEIQKGSDFISTNLSKLLRNSHFKDLFSEKVDSVIRAINGLIDHSSRIEPEILLRDLGQLVQHYATLYSMDSEREIHARLFHDDSVLNTPESGGEDSDEVWGDMGSEDLLGDNVDLF